MTLKASSDKSVSNKSKKRKNVGDSSDGQKSCEKTKKENDSDSAKTKEKQDIGDESFTSKTSPSEEPKSHSRSRVCRRLLTPTMPSSFVPISVPPCNYQYNVNISYPVSVDDWSTVMAPVQYATLPNCPYNVPFQPVQVYPMLPSPIYPYSGSLMPPPMCYHSPVLTVPITEFPISYGYDNAHCSPEQIVPNEPNATFSTNPANLSAEETMYEAPPQEEFENDDESFLRLPRNLFPTARMLDLDPNPIIDEMCRLKNLSTNVPWILDLEFGVSRVSSNRPIPIYDVKYNSIHCRNTPNAIHPGFESCNEIFQRVFLFYYDSVVSTWYRGFVHTSLDCSVENFQTWLLWGMHLYGMCWP